jgi:hypothetical protein
MLAKIIERAAKLKADRGDRSRRTPVHHAGKKVTKARNKTKPKSLDLRVREKPSWLI